MLDRNKYFINACLIVNIYVIYNALIHLISLTMVKRKEVLEEVSEDPAILAKKHKKHSKHKKHKKKKTDVEEDENLKVTIKLPSEDESPNKLIGMSNQTKPGEMKAPSQVGSSPKGTTSKKKKKKGKDSGTSSEEERWLDAIESGKLEEVDDELKKIKPKDPNLMTARQRAMFERKTDKESPGEQLLALPTGYREKVMTPEMVQKAAIKSQKRKQQADEKREKDKKKTMERLLRKQESKLGKVASRGKSNKRQVPLVIYSKTAEGITMSFPPNMEIPMKSSVASSPPKVRLCEVIGCKNPRKYSCSKTGKSLCSLLCYKKNLKITS